MMCIIYVKSDAAVVLLGGTAQRVASDALKLSLPRGELCAGHTNIYLPQKNTGTQYLALFTKTQE